jgi:hypothetical protein
MHETRRAGQAGQQVLQAACPNIGIDLFPRQHGHPDT